jgi:hypothetical protein
VGSFLQAGSNSQQLQLLFRVCEVEGAWLLQVAVSIHRIAGGLVPAFTLLTIVMVWQR